MYIYRTLCNIFIHTVAIERHRVDTVSPYPTRIYMSKCECYTRHDVYTPVSSSRFRVQSPRESVPQGLCTVDRNDHEFRRAIIKQTEKRKRLIATRNPYTPTRTPRVLAEPDGGRPKPSARWSSGRPGHHSLSNRITVNRNKNKTNKFANQPKSEDQTTRIHTATGTRVYTHV